MSCGRSVITLSVLLISSFSCSYLKSRRRTVMQDIYLISLWFKYFHTFPLIVFFSPPLNTVVMMLFIIIWFLISGIASPDTIQRWYQTFSVSVSFSGWLCVSLYGVCAFLCARASGERLHDSLCLQMCCGCVIMKLIKLYFNSELYFWECDCGAEYPHSQSSLH